MGWLQWKVPLHINSSICTPVCPELMVAVFGMPFATSHSCWVWWLSDGCSYKKIVCVCRLTVHFCWQWTVVGPFWGLSLITHVVPPLPVQSSSIDVYDYGKVITSGHCIFKVMIKEVLVFCTSLASRRQKHRFQIKSHSLPNYPSLTVLAHISSLQPPPSAHYLLNVPNRDLVSFYVICYSFDCSV